MAEYQVDYQINVQSDGALNAIEQFKTATASLNNLTKDISNVTKKIGKINSAFRHLETKIPELKINADPALKSISTVKAQLTSLQSQATIRLTIDSNIFNESTNKKNKKSVMSSIREGVDEAYDKLQRQISSSKKSVDDFNKLSINPTVTITSAMKQLEELDRKILSVRNKTKGPWEINLKVNETASSVAPVGADSALKEGMTIVETPDSKSKKPKAKETRTSTTRARRGMGLYPSTESVLGPTYLNTGGSIVGEMVKSMGVAYGLGAVMSGVTQVFQDATEYKNISETTRNILGTHDKRFDFDQRFEETNLLMRQVGMNTKYTAPEVAEAGKFLAMAGYNIDDIKKSITPIANIALIGDTDLGETADVVTNIMTSYELDPARMDNAADILTMTFTKTNTTLMELAESFKYAGTIAHQTGLSFEETSAAFGVLGNAGIKGSQAGTTIRMMLLNMLNPTKKQRAAWKEAGVNISDQYGNIRQLSDIMHDLHEVSERMSAYDFTKLIGKMFRVTAAPGALALINASDDMRQVMDLNYGAAGLSAEKAKAKQNTTKGLWAQFTSAFTESGMRGFEQIESGVNAFLKRAIAMMNSDKFREGLADIMNMFMKLAQSILEVADTVVRVWNWLPSSFKNLLVTFAKVQMYITLGNGALQSFRSTLKGILGVLAGDWLGKSFGRLYLILAQIFVTAKRIGKYGLLTSLEVLMKRWNISFSHLVQTATAANVAGSTLSHNPILNTSLWTSVIRPVGKFLFSLKGILVTMAAIPLVSMTIGIWNSHKAATAATEANKKWVKSFQMLNTDLLDSQDPNSTWIGTWRIANSELLTHEQKLQSILDLYDQIALKKAGTPPKLEDKTPFIETETPLAQDYKALIDVANSMFPDSGVFEERIKKLGGTIQAVPGMFTKYSLKLGKSYYPVFEDSGGIQVPKEGAPSESIGIALSKDAMAALAYASVASNRENPILKQFELNSVTRLFRAADWKDFNQMYHQFMDEIDSWRTPYTNYKIDRNEAEHETEEQVYQHGASVDFLQDIAYNILSSTLSWGQILLELKDNRDVEPVYIQEILGLRNLFFDPQKYGVFGSEQWISAIQKELDNNKSSVEGDKSIVLTMWNDLLNLFNHIPTQYQYLFAPYLNRSAFEALIPGIELPEGGFEGGKPGDKITGRDKDKYTWMHPFANGKSNTQAPMFYYNQKGQPILLDRYGKIAGVIPTMDNPYGDKNEAGGDGTGGDDDFGKSKYSNVSSAPKQVIVRIENLMNVENVDLTDERKAAVVTNLKEELAQALIDVVQDFNANISNT